MGAYETDSHGSCKEHKHNHRSVVVTVEPDGTLVGLAVLGIVDFAAFPLVLFLGETSQNVDTNQFAAL